MQQEATIYGGEPNPLDTTGLCLLSLDGGGVRGLSSLYILKSIMDRLNHAREQSQLPPVKPLIAIMLGRLEMDVDQCIDAYSDLAAAVFSEKLHSVPINFKGNITARFNSATLESAILKVVEDSGADKQDLFDDAAARGCKTFVCTADRHTKDIVRLRSYSLSHEPKIRTTICQAALATSAATTFFEPVSIGNRSFADGGLGANNPVDEVEGEASNIWFPETGDLKPHVKCFISIGTGNPGKKPFEDNIFKFLGQTVVQIATETENTERRFIARWAKQFDEKRYFRLNVEQGLQEIGLEEYKKKGAIEAATEGYLTHITQKFRVRDCIENMRLKENKTEMSFSTILHKHTTRANQRQWKSVHRFDVPFDLTYMPVIETNFMGRQEELEQLWQSIQPSRSEQQKVAIVHGLGGMGKTQLAIRFARDHKRDFTAIFWLNGKDRATLVQSLSSNLPRLTGQSQNADAIIDEEAEQRSTVVRQAYDVQKFFPGADHGSILITSRLESLTELGESFPIHRLNPKDAIQLLLRSSRLSVDTTVGELRNSPEILTLASRLDGLPLAIVIAGSYIRKTGTSVTRYLQLYQESWSSLQSQSRSGPQYQHGNMLQTWLISYREIQKRDSKAAQLLLLLAHFDNQDTWYELIQSGCEGSDVPLWLYESAATFLAFSIRVSILIEFSLLEVKQQKESYTMHPVVQDWCLHVSSTDRYLVSLRLNELALISVGYTVPNLSEKNSAELQRRLIPHANRILDTDWSGEDTRVQGALNGLGNLYRHQGKLKEAEEIYQRAMAGKGMALGPDHTSTLNTVHNLGALYYDQGKLNKAEEMYQRALSGYKKALGPDHSSTLSTVHQLGALYSKQGKLKKAEEMYQRALIGSEKAVGLDHTSTLEIFNSLGNLYSKQEKLKKAEEMYQRAISGYEKALGLGHTSTLNTINNLGALYRDQGKLKEAEEMYQRALVGKEKALGLDHTSTLDTVNNLGLLYSDQGKLKEAEEMYQRALAGNEKALGLDHTSTLNTINNLGSLYYDQGKLNKAEEMYQRAISGYEKGLGPDHTSTLDTINNLGALYSNQGKLNKAEKMYQRALAGCEKALSLDHTSTLNAVNNLGNLYTKQGKLMEAEEMYQRALAGYEKALGLGHTFTLNTVNNLGNLYSKQGKLNEAEEMYQRALVGCEKALGLDHTSTLDELNNLGALYYNQGKLNEAEEMYQRALAGYERALGPDHTSTLVTVNNLGNLYSKQGKPEKAEEMYQRALAGKEKALGPDPTSTLDAFNNLGLLYSDQGKLNKAEEMYQQELPGSRKATDLNFSRGQRAVKRFTKWLKHRQ
ncbi:hypothetical protein PENANT_c007G05014 [Penicillium antarcticum]|uniref:PNPLA domain-containing protein n=1 Tax=Penicillium antarcticum TaxID=416450 RepID=A0A1V6QBP5_9EURO|nr:hypothetical protein PENANT_c007G05014 [Penicillium antarcticum]